MTDRHRHSWKGGTKCLGCGVTKGRLVRFHVIQNARAQGYAAGLTDVRERIESRIAVLSRPEGNHRYMRGGIHAEVTDCGECGRLHELRSILPILEHLP